MIFFLFLLYSYECLTRQHFLLFKNFVVEVSELAKIAVHRNACIYKLQIIRSVSLRSSDVFDIFFKEKNA